MFTHDITGLLMKNYPDCYIFNPSMIHLKDTIYLVVYRICRYNYPAPRAYHNPWKTWDNGYKFFSNPSFVLSLKYRDENDFEGVRRIQLENDNTLIKIETDEYDSTSLAVIDIDSAGLYRVIYNVETPFGMSMNQDARVQRVDDQIYITYNVFHTRSIIRLRKRTVDIDLEECTCTFGPEEPLFDHCYKNVEKNCVMSPFRGHILYKIGRTFDVIIGPHLFIRKPCPLAALIDHYGEEHVQCSISTPAIEFVAERWLACAHIKLVYKKIKIEPLLTFLSRARFYNIHLDGNVHPHGKYIYLAYFFEFDKNYNITRHSNMFIPSIFSEHLPYLLVMPTGLCRVGGQIHMSYGEGDRKCKVLTLGDNEMNDILNYANVFGAHFLTRAAHIVHLGYFGFKNTGDDAFVKVFEYLHQRYYPYATIEFIKPTIKPKFEASLTILGGGDVLTDFFLQHPMDNAVAIGVGIPYDVFDVHVAQFKEVIIRNPQKIDSLRALNPRVTYYPDLCFLLSKVFSNLQIAARLPMTIGVSVLRTYYNAAYPEIYLNYVQTTADWIDLILDREPVITFWLIPFGVNQNKPAENDVIACNDIMARARHSDSIRILKVDVENNVEHIYTFIKTLEFMVCARFHSHIFSTVCEVPFVSLTCGTKCINYMHQSNLSDYLYILPKNDLDLPVQLDVKSIAQFVHHHYHKRGKLKERVRMVNAAALKLMDEFEVEYLEILKRHARERPYMFSS